jgi:FHA domain
LAILVETASGRRLVLLPQHVFGRDCRASTLINGPGTSRLHASIRWTGSTWAVIDHSRNGTTLDGNRIPYNTAVELRAGQTLVFGIQGAAEWQVQDLERPGPMLLSLEGQEGISLPHSTLLLENGMASMSIVSQLNGIWICTSEDGSRTLQDGDEIVISGRRWCFYSGAGQITEKVSSSPSPLCVARFEVSQDEEHVTLRLRHGDHDLDLGERTHHYVLLTLARLQADDAKRGLAPSEQGWVYQDRLAKMLGLGSAHLNIQIFRLRKQLAQALGQEVAPPALIQRRRGELRIGNVTAEIRSSLSRPLTTSSISPRHPSLV